MPAWNKASVTSARVAFEAWLLAAHDIHAHRTRKGYTDNVVRIAWRAYQAGRAAERLNALPPTPPQTPAIARNVAPIPGHGAGFPWSGLDALGKYAPDL